MKIVCISAKAQHGKDTTAGFLKEVLEAQGKKVLIAHFGDAVKFVAEKYFGWNGKKDEAGRTLLQYVGTERVRAQSPDFWVNFVVSMLTFFNGEWDYVLIPDCRFPNEYEIFKDYGFEATLIRVERPGFDNGLTPDQKAHPSETALDGYPFDAVITNGGTLDQLKHAIEYAIYAEGIV